MIAQMYETEGIRIHYLSFLQSPFILDVTVHLQAISGTIQIPASPPCSAEEAGCNFKEGRGVPRPLVTHLVFNQIGNRKRFIPRVVQISTVEGETRTRTSSRNTGNSIQPFIYQYSECPSGVGEEVLHYSTNHALLSFHQTCPPFSTSSHYPLSNSTSVSARELIPFIHYSGT